VGWGSVVGIATGYTPDDLGIESWLGVSFSTPVQTGLGAYPAFYTMGTIFPSQAYSSWGMTLTSHPPSSYEVKERVELYLYSPSGPSYRLKFTFALP